MSGSVQRIGIYGGSFDPVHWGHVWVAHAALEELELARLFVVPTAQSPFKPHNKLALPEMRLALLRLAFASHPAIEIDDQELQRGGISYTIDTLRAYQHQFPNAGLFYLIGTDHVEQLTQWKEADELARLATFVAIPRPGCMTVQFPAPFRGIHLHGFPTSLSASEIRQRIQRDKPIDFLVPPGVAERLHLWELYKNKPDRIN